MSSHHAVGSSRGRKPQLHTNTSGATAAAAAAAAAAGALGGSSLDKPHEVMIKMEPHSEMSEVGQWTAQNNQNDKIHIAL
jgi:cobalamin biosynthesis protein CbiD